MRNADEIREGNAYKSIGFWLSMILTPIPIIIAAVVIHVAGKENPAAANRAAELFHGAMWAASLIVILITVIVISSMLSHPRIIN